MRRVGYDVVPEVPTISGDIATLGCALVTGGIGILTCSHDGGNMVGGMVTRCGAGTWLYINMVTLDGAYRGNAGT